MKTNTDKEMATPFLSKFDSTNGERSLQIPDRSIEKTSKILPPGVSIEALLHPEGSSINNEKLTDELLEDLRQIADKYGLRLEMASVISYRYDRVPGTEFYEYVECGNSGLGVFDMRLLY